jgi:murein DD-endopeptidase MepM/ murein hydrolase activator NlpD
MKIPSPLPNAVLKYHNNGGDVTQWFGENESLYAKYTPESPYHSGIDIKAEKGTPIYAPFDGKIEGLVRVQDKMTMGGNITYLHSKDFLDEDNLTKKLILGFLHQSEILVEINQEVKEGDLIGKVGNSGFVISGGSIFWDDAKGDDGSHLHFSIAPQEKIGTGYKMIPNFWGRGTTDPCPWLMLGTRYQFVSDIFPGKRGYDVYALQSYLKEQGFLNHKPTGYYGSYTLGAIMGFQYKNGITPFMGYCGTKTRTLLNSRM